MAQSRINRKIAHALMNRAEEVRDILMESWDEILRLQELLDDACANWYGPMPPEVRAYWVNRREVLAAKERKGRKS